MHNFTLRSWVTSVRSIHIMPPGSYIMFGILSFLFKWLILNKNNNRFGKQSENPLATLHNVSGNKILC